MAYETEEQQVEAIKNFWKENGTSIIAGAVIGLGGLFGWRYYADQQLLNQEQASAGYEQAVKTVSSEPAKAAEFTAQNQQAAYGQLAALQLAKTYVEKNQLDEALQQLQLVIDNGDKNTLKPVAVLRAARINLAQEKYADALALVEQQLPEAFKAEAAEIKGDILAKQGNIEQARIAYQAAADAGGLTSSSALQMKMDNVTTTNGGV